MSSADYDGDELNYTLPRKGKIHDWFIFAPLMVSYIGISVPDTELLNAICIFITAVITYYFVSKDRALLMQANYDAPAQVWWLILPVYIWKRCTLTKKGRASFWVYMLLYVICMALSWYQLDRTDKLEVADVACNVVTKLSVDGGGVDAPACLRVVLEEQVTTNNWKAIAQMDNGTTRQLGVNYNPDTDYVSVKLSGYSGYFN